MTHPQEHDPTVRTFSLPPKHRHPVLVAQPCSTEFYPAVDQSGARAKSDVHSVVIHCTEGYTARGAASYFRSGTPGQVGSTQLIVDDNECYRSVDDLRVCWGAPPLNDNGLHIEQAGFTTFSNFVWSRKHRKMLRRCAWKVAQWCVAYDIPIKLLRTADLVKQGPGARGITAHMFVSEAFHQSTHSDPGPNYPYKLFMLFVTRYAARIRRQRASDRARLPVAGQRMVSRPA